MSLDNDRLIYYNHIARWEERIEEDVSCAARLLRLRGHDLRVEGYSTWDQYGVLTAIKSLLGHIRVEKRPIQGDSEPKLCAASLQRKHIIEASDLVPAL